MSSIIVSVTDIGRLRLTDLQINGRGFIIDQFVLGDGGHDPSDPSVALAPDIQATSLPGQTFGPNAIYSSSMTGLYCPSFRIIVNPSEAIGELSNIGLVGSINYVPSGIPADPVVGSTFLFAIGNFPLIVKTSIQTWDFDINIQF